jgi:hypothetical protein
MLKEKITNIQELSNGSKHERLKKLYEMYRRPDFSWVHIMMERIYENPNDIDEIANEYNVEFNDGGYGKKLITSAGLKKSGKIHIELNVNAVNLILRGKHRSLIEDEIEEVLAHENTHIQQNQLKNIEQSYYNKASTWEERKKYLSQYVEIDAFARQVSKSMEDRGFSESDISNIQQLKLSDLSNDLIEDYFRIGGEILQKFLSEIYKWFKEPPVGNEIEYKNWLRSHR